MSKYNCSSKRKYRNNEEPEEEEVTTEIRVENNDMYIYSEITRELALNFSIELKILLDTFLHLKVVLVMFWLDFLV